MTTKTASLTGPSLFARYAYAPNLLGYCGPNDTELLTQMMEETSPPFAELASVAGQFEGAYPYLELIAAATARHPMDQRVVEAYWTGNRLLHDVDLLLWGNSVDDRFRKRSAGEWDAVKQAILFGGLPTHAFHVFCVYPWVGLLQTGSVGPALEVLDRCRISWGAVARLNQGEAVVRSKRLQWVDDQLVRATPTDDRFRVPAGFGRLEAGDAVSLHWDTVCERLTPERTTALRRYHDWHLSLANAVLRT